MRDCFKYLALFSLGLAVLGSCKKVEDDTIPSDELIERKDFVLTRSERAFIQSNNGFALDLFKQVVRRGEGKALLISPLSITIDFGMVNNGAAGVTREEISRVLGYQETSIDGLNAFCRSMMDQSSAVDPSTTLELANAGVINSRFSALKDDFTKAVKTYYDAEIIYKDFATDNIVALVNNWCDRKTHGMIPELLKDPVSPQSYAHFLNAVYFKGIWSEKFSKSETRKEPFTREDGGQVSVSMMHQKHTASYGGVSGLCEALTLPYGNQAYRMTVILPQEGLPLGKLVEKLDTDTWNALMASFGSVEVDIKFPSFEVESTFELQDLLQEMGMTTAFGDWADFSNMTKTSVCIDKVLHKARIKVDEEGSEAAAVTDIEMRKTTSSGPGGKPVTFHADRPFLFAITEVSSGAIYFLGQYTGK